MNFFNLFQLLYVSTFLAIFVTRTITTLLKRNNPFSLGVGKRGVHVIIELSLIVFLFIWIYEVFVYSLGSTRHIAPTPFHHMLFDIPFLKYAGVCINVIGMVLFVSALWAFRESWRMGIDKRNPGELITNGIFRISRNPIFFFIDLYFCGTFLIYPTPFFFIMAVLTVGVLHYQILKEERFLADHYGDSYTTYTGETGRYISVCPRRHGKAAH